MQCQESGWTYVHEVDDDPTVDDIPNSPSDVAAGYATANAYYIGNAALDAMTWTQLEVCIGQYSLAGACAFDCRPILANQAAFGITNDKFPTVSGMSSNFKKLAACWVGQCDGNSYGSTGWFWECREAACDTDTWVANGVPWSNIGGSRPRQPWSITGAGAYYAGAGPQGGNLLHIWGSGLTRWNTQNVEQTMHNNGPNQPTANNAFQVRVK